MKRYLQTLIRTLSCVALAGCYSQTAGSSAEEQVYNIPVQGNAYVEAGSAYIDDNGIANWSSLNDLIALYVKINNIGTLNITPNAATPEQPSKIRITANNDSKDIIFSKRTGNRQMLTTKIQKPGYLRIALRGLDRNANTYADLKGLKLSGSAVQTAPLYVNQSGFYYWGRRGPSCHLNYRVPKSENAEYFYTEVEVPPGCDPMGSYMMAVGFAEGYFGMQVNSDKERRVLFSVWSPYKTDNPKDIPEDYKIKLLRKGTGVHGGEFGNEGSGGQSWMKYSWEAGKTYAFLVKATPNGNGMTEYSAWFQDTGQQKWHLIASFSRPHTNTYLKHFHSFLENFNPDKGFLTRKAYYKNQWYYTDRWHPVHEAVLTMDNTFVSKQRTDATGGVEGGKFFLQQGGFKDEDARPFTKFETFQSQMPPAIDFKLLP